MVGRQLTASLFVAWVVLLLQTPAFGFRTGPPSGFNGSTASGGTSCRVCHGNAVGVGSVTILNAPLNYVPGATYDLTVRVQDDTKLGGGFQISVEDPAGNHAGLLIVTDPINTQENLEWVNHTITGVDNAVDNWAALGNAAEYNVRWQAPECIGPVTFWVAGNAINNNNSSTGDTIYLNSVDSTPMAICPPSVGDDTCQTTNADTGVPCSTDADCTAPAVCGNKSRYVSVTAAAGGPTSIQVEIVSIPQFPSMVGDIYYAGVEQSIPNSPNPALRGARLLCEPTPSNSQVWTPGVLHLFGQALVPGSTYNVRMCDAAGANCSDPLLVATAKWGDVVRPFGGGSQPNFGDINSVVQKFSNIATAPSTARADLVGAGNPGETNTPNQATNLADVSFDVFAFNGFPYPFTVNSCP